MSNPEMRKTMDILKNLIQEELNCLNHKNLIKYHTTFQNRKEKSKQMVQFHKNLTLTLAFEIITDYIHGSLKNIMKQFGPFEESRAALNLS
jgi:hypothetical protein